MLRVGKKLIFFKGGKPMSISKTVALSSGMLFSLIFSAHVSANTLVSNVVTTNGVAVEAAPQADAQPPAPAKPTMLLPYDPTIRLRGPIRNPTYDKNLLVSLQSNYMKEAERWYDEGSDVNSFDPQGRSLLYLAIFSGRMENVKFLLLRRANVNLKNQDGTTPMGAAVLRGSVPIMQYLMERGASTVGKVEGSGESYLQYAVKRGLTDIAQILLDKGADVNERYPTGESLLQVAVASGNEMLAYQLMLKGADVDAAASDGITSLHEAAAKGYLNMAKLLLQRKANVNAVTRKNWTPLHHAARFGQYDMVRLLLSRGADPTMRNSDGKSPLGLARQLQHVNVSELLSSL
jgi:ankyrin repeat protein